MTPDQQINAIQPLLDQIVEILAQDKGMAGRIAPRSNVEQGGGVTEKGKTVLEECAEWHDAAEACSILNNYPEKARMHREFATACREANEQ